MEALSVISTGLLEPGFKPRQVVDNIISTFKISEQKTIILGKKDAVIMRNISHELALNLKDKFAKCGLKVVIKPRQIDQDFTSHSPPDGMDYNTTYEHKEDFEKLLTGEFVASEISASYRKSLLWALAASFIAPLIYFSMLFTVVYAGLKYASFLSDNLQHLGFFISLLVIIVPYFMIIIVAIFLTRPLFISSEPPEYFEMYRKDAPALFNLIDVMSEKLSVPFPEQICLDTNINASAGAMYGYSCLRQGKLRLTIGLPLLLGLNVRQFSGILAHEFGHFSQPIAMRVYYVINRINFWFYHRAYRPDKLDKLLEQWSEKADLPITGTLSILGAKIALKLTRLILKILYKANLRFTQSMSRQMEYDADCYESQFVGSNQFEQTSIDIRKLSYAAEIVDKMNQKSWSEKKLLANIPSAIVHFASKLDKTVDECIKQDMQEGETSPWDSHPADNDRIQHIIERNEPGIFTIEFPAKSLVKSINKLCELATINAYTRLGIRSARQYTVANNRLMEHDDRKEEWALSYRKFFNSNNEIRFLNLAPMLEDKPESHIQCMNSIRQLTPQFTVDFDQLNEHLQQSNKLILAKAYLQSDIKVDITNLNIEEDSIHAIEAELQKLRDESAVKKALLFPFDQLFYERIIFNKKGLSNEQNNIVDQLLKSLQGMFLLEPFIIDLQRYIYVFASLSSCEEEEFEQVAPAIDRLADVMFKTAHQLMSEAKQIKMYDEKFHDLAMFIESWSGILPPEKQVYPFDEYFEMAEQICKSIHYQYYWYFAELANICNKVELEQKITPLTFPAQKI